MKVSPYELIILFIILVGITSCSNDKEILQGLWVQAYSESKTTYSTLRKGGFNRNKRDGFYIDTVDLKCIFLFDKDSLTVTDFYDTYYYGYIESTHFCPFKGDSLCLEVSESGSSVKIPSNENGLLKYKFQVHPSKALTKHFIKCEEHEMVTQKERINSFLINNPITIGKRLDKIELLPSSWYMGKFIQDDFKANYGSGDNWHFYSIKNELFLLISDLLFHISDFDGNKIYAYTYNPKRAKVQIEKSSYKEYNNVEDLIGRWGVTDTLKTKNQIGVIQDIEFNGNDLIFNTLGFSDTIKWKLNRYTNIILTEKNGRNRYAPYWKIKHLSPYKLIIETKRYSNSGFKTFYKKE